MVIHGVAPSARALGEEDFLFGVRVEGELERDGAREHLSGVRDGRSRQSWSHCFQYGVML